MEWPELQGRRRILIYESALCGVDELGVPQTILGLEDECRVCDKKTARAP